MKIAVLGWGSLIWDPRELQIVGAWKKKGPTLKIEFSRISNNKRLTLVIDEANGVPVTTRYALSGLTSLDAAIKNLQEREELPSAKRVGWINLSKGEDDEVAKKAHPNEFEVIRAWAKENKFDAIIWTALGSNFADHDKAAEPFSTILYPT